MADGRDRTDRGTITEAEDRTAEVPVPTGNLTAGAADRITETADPVTRHSAAMTDVRAATGINFAGTTETGTAAVLTAVRQSRSARQRNRETVTARTAGKTATATTGRTDLKIRRLLKRMSNQDSSRRRKKRKPSRRSCFLIRLQSRSLPTR